MRYTQYSFLPLGMMILCAAPVRAQSPVAAAKYPNSSVRSNAALQRLVTVTLDQVMLSRAIAELSARAGVMIQYRAEVIAPIDVRVTLHAVGMPLGLALDRVLARTSLHAIASAEDVITIQAIPEMQTAQGGIAGKITDIATRQPVRGATVSLDADNRGMTSDDAGGFRLVGVTPGTHTIQVRRVGYIRQTRTVTVGDGAVTTENFQLEPSASVLDQVVVTGMVIPTERKAVPNAMTVITAKDLERRGIMHIDQLFRGDVPGLFALNRGSEAPLGQVTMFSRGAANLDVTIGYFGSNVIKTYVDGVELADPSYLSQLDPKSIERIEILTGPQASTIYGSNAINGVMQIFTKRGTSNTPQLTLNLLSGWVENNFSNSRTPQHDYSAQINGIEGRFSYNAGGSWNYLGPWTPAIQQTVTSGFGGGRIQLGSVTADASLRLSTTVNRQRGYNQQLNTAFQETGFYDLTSFPFGLARHDVYTLRGQTLGLALGYTLAPWWSHELVLGTDAADTEQRALGALRRFPSDTTLFLSQAIDHRTTFQYTTTAKLPMTRWSILTVSAGADGWHNIMSSLTTSPVALTGTLTGTPTVTRQPGHNTGGFVQGQWSAWDALFLTYGLRAEWNPNYGAEAQPNYAPRYGVAYTRDIDTPFGMVTTKVRGSYGRSTQPPGVGQKTAKPDVSFSAYSPYYGNYLGQLANPALGPQTQQGGEGGLELYFGTRGSLVVTRYNQTVNDAILFVPGADSVRSLLPNPRYYDSIDPTTGYGYHYQYQYLNAGNIRNQGWELQQTAVVGPLTAKGTYSWTKSRVIGIASQYRWLLTGAQFQPGAAFNRFPEHTWALGLTYGQHATSIALDVAGRGQVTGLQNMLFFQGFTSRIRLQQNMMRLSLPGSYLYPPSRAYATADCNLTHRFSSMLDAVIQIQNLTNHYGSESGLAFATLGRQTKAGVRILFR